MQKNILKYTLLLGIAALWSCEPNVDEFKPSKGTADFSKFIAIGDSYTAGYTDGALGKRGQEESFSYILGKQLMYVGSSSYNQPLVKSEGSVGTTVLGPNQNNGYFELKEVDGSLAPVPSLGDMAIFSEKVQSVENQNFGVPGAKATHLALEAPYPPYASLNPFYARFASAPDATVIGDAMMAQPTFFSLWIGNNDVLAYALQGGDVDESDPNDPNLITAPAVYQEAMTGYIQTLTSAGAKGVVGNIPAIDAIPFFNTVPYDAFVIDAATAAALNQNYEAYNAAAEQMGLAKMEFKEGANAFIIHDANIPVQLGNRRQATEKDKLLLTASSYGTTPEFAADPIMIDKYVLTQSELTKISEATVAYNNTIAGLASDNIAVVNLASIMTELSTKGLIIDGHKYTSTLVTGGVFSLDGIHATGRGSAIIANAFIDAINAKFGAIVPRANINDYDMVMFP